MSNRMLGRLMWLGVLAVGLACGSAAAQGGAPRAGTGAPPRVNDLMMSLGGAGGPGLQACLSQIKGDASLTETSFARQRCFEQAQQRSPAMPAAGSLPTQDWAAGALQKAQQMSQQQGQ